MSSGNGSAMRATGFQPSASRGRGRSLAIETAAETGDAHSGQMSDSAPAAHSSAAQTSRTEGYSRGHFPQKARSTPAAGKTTSPSISRMAALPQSRYTPPL